MLRPRLFLSYSSADRAVADALKRSLDPFAIVYYAGEDMLAGEDFVSRLTGELRRCDALVAVITPASAGSAWCLAEWYYAHARGVQVIPVRSGESRAEVPEPLRLMQERIHFLDLADPSKLPATLADDLRRARRTVLRKRLFTSILVSALVAAVVGGAFLVIRQSAAVEHWRHRRDVLNDITRVVQPWRSSIISRLASQFQGDQTFLDALLGIASDPLAADPPRLSALSLSHELLRSRKPEARWYVRNVEWTDGVLNDASVGNITFVSGTIQNLRVQGSSLAGVWWSGDVNVIGCVFDDVKFEGVSFEPRNAIEVTFHDAVFRGSTVDVTNFSLVRFASSPAGDVITPNLGAFEESVIINRRQKPAPHVLDLGEPEKQVRFEGVVFNHVRFEGWVRPDWFRNCSFEACTFPSDFDVNTLRGRGNVGVGK